jgi:7-cyano-7-deazaguanine synthase
MRGANRSAIVLLSGGLDSATTVAIAQSEGFDCHALTFDYGQRHRIEIDAARNVAASMRVRDHVIMSIDLRALGGSALTDERIDVPKDRLGVKALTPNPSPIDCRGVSHRESNSASARQSVGEGGDIPITYVPARNTIFLSSALALAEVRNASDIFIGVNAIDYSGYPDCRPAFIRAFEAMANLATKAATEGNRLTIHTPLIDLTKAQIIRRGIGLGVDYSLTRSCYDPEQGTGRPCGHCDSCLLRSEGFKAAGIDDPAVNGS